MNSTEQHIYDTALLATTLNRDKQIEHLASKFSSIMHQLIGPINLAEVIKRNRNYRAQNTDCCALHEFCDPNPYMDHILALNGIPAKFPADGNSAYTEYCKLWSDVWKKAQENEFRVSISNQ